MNIEHVVRVFRNCGYIINQINGFYFLERGWINYSFPQLIDIPVNNNLIKSLRWKYPLTVIKTKAQIKNTYEFLLDTNDYSIGKFSQKKRNDIRRSLRDCTFKKPPLEDLVKYGLEMNRQTMERQERNDKYLTRYKLWQKYITTFYNEENIFILGAYIADKIVGYITVCKITGSYYIIDPFYDKKASASSPMHGLIFALVNQLIERDGSIKMYYGVDSFVPLPALSKYKQSMLFKRVPATRVYVVNPILLSCLRLIITICINLFKQKSIKNPRIQNIVRIVQGNRIIYKSNPQIRT